MKYEDGMLILGQNDIFCVRNVVDGFFNCLVASHVTELGSLLTEPGAVIK